MQIFIKLPSVSYQRCGFGHCGLVLGLSKFQIVTKAQGSISPTCLRMYSLNVQNIKVARKMLVKLTRSRNKKVAHIKKGQNRYKIAIPLFFIMVHSASLKHYVLNLQPFRNFKTGKDGKGTKFGRNNI